jgi:N,N'-diacetyllegionaminate synthase
VTTRIEIIAEVANAHQGDPAQAERLALDGLSAGADAVKFQIYFAEELLVRAHPRYEHFKRQSFSRDAWRDLIGRIKRAGAQVYCDVFGIGALQTALENGADGIKVHSSDLTNEPLLERLAETSKRVILSVGGSSATEIALAIRHVARDGRRPVLLHGFQSYPTAVEDSALARLQWLKRNFGAMCDIGYQDHVSGDDEFAAMLPVLAMGMGATVLEKHITLDRAAKGVDYYSSLNPPEFAAFVRTIRRCEVAIGAREDVFSASEREYRRTVKKHWVAARPLKTGEVLGAESVVMKRVHEATSETVELDKLVGRPLVRDLADEQICTRGDVKQVVWAVVVARMRSSRLPGKALIDMAGMPALAHLFERLKQAKTVNRIVLCTTTEHEDDPLAKLAAASGIACHRGPIEDVLGRMIGAMEGHRVDVALRVTGDDILVDPDYVDRAVRHHLSSNAEYSDLKALPSGTEVEVFDADLLRLIHKAAADPQGTEYLTNYVTANADQIRRGSVPVPTNHARSWRLTLDTPEDYQVISGLLQAMKREGKALTYRLDDIVAYFTNNPEAAAANAGVRQRQTPPKVRTELDWGRLLAPPH